jgi:aerotaxis receptor
MGRRDLTPSGAERFVGPQELFFSTTDRRGIIKTGNSVFSRVSQYAIEDMVGAPHNIVRHPDMPSGAYRLMWDRLLSGRPMAAYVKNLARDGASYWVFATVVPLGEDFLSVRMAPAAPLADAARRIYQTVAEDERDLAVRERLPRPEVAAAGAVRIEQALGQLGYHSYDEFMLQALPTEVAARGRLLSTSFARPQAHGTLAEILDSARQIDGQLEVLVGRLARYTTLTSDLGPAAGAVLANATGLQASVDAARSASARVGDQAPVLRNVAQVMGHPMASAVAALQELAPRLSDLRCEVAELGFGIALAQLHTEMMGAFAAEVVDGVAPASALAEIPRLCDAVDQGVQAMAEAIEDVNQRLHVVVDRIRRSEELLGDFRRFLGQWWILVLRHRQGGAVADYRAPIDDQLDATADQLAYLRTLGDQCQAAVAPFDRSRLEPHLNRVRAAVGYARV